MAEAIGLLASVVTVAGLAYSASKKLNKAATECDLENETINHVRVQAEATKAVLEGLEAFLREPKSPQLAGHIETLSLESSLQSTATVCKELEQKIVRLTGSSSVGDKKLAKKLYVLMQPQKKIWNEIDRYRERLGDSQRTLSLTLTTLTTLQSYTSLQQVHNSMSSHRQMLAVQEGKLKDMKQMMEALAQSLTLKFANPSPPLPVEDGKHHRSGSSPLEDFSTPPQYATSPNHGSGLNLNSLVKEDEPTLIPNFASGAAFATTNSEILNSIENMNEPLFLPPDPVPSDQPPGAPQQVPPPIPDIYGGAFYGSAASFSNYPIHFSPPDPVASDSAIVWPQSKSLPVIDDFESIMLEFDEAPFPGMQENHPPENEEVISSIGRGTENLGEEKIADDEAVKSDMLVWKALSATCSGALKVIEEVIASEARGSQVIKRQSVELENPGPTKRRKGNPVSN